ncbi:hypothetical protein XfCFBP8356_012285 [Xylella fastidiosa subsp. sandyi]|uniref:Uncharacterized protein n=3 Tax=Xylella fastidiosa TaxID=2371 RepID=A0AAJ5R1P3_XYLFS|nr:hypothetical protein [Xylella fastidiosa]WCF28251.1 hypothetical protein OK117_11675 [Xylella fastidiosa subsp. fastidiosa]
MSDCSACGCYQVCKECFIEGMARCSLHQWTLKQQRRSQEVNIRFGEVHCLGLLLFVAKRKEDAAVGRGGRSATAEASVRLVLA